MIPGMHFHSRHDGPFILSASELVVVHRFTFKSGSFIGHSSFLQSFIGQNIIHGLVDLSGMN